MPQWMQDLAAGWPMIEANLPTFAVILMLMIGAIWAVFTFTYSGIISSKNAQIELQDRQLADYRDKLRGATPEEAKAKIDALERAVRITIGARWEPLTGTELAVLVPKLKEIPKSRVQIMYENPFGKDLAESFLDAFKQAGWDGAWMTGGSGFGEGIVTGWSTRAAKVKEAVEASSKLKLWVKDQEKEVSDLLIVGVGINSY